ncbi:type II toxin-antitoxin system ParD family antitoxin [Thalassococcus sp. S3]|uniref:type II toxin-antitoxin system ParD family antitoxin n=1 Tax=Thalassococcus sp. S3 TaxID=2017482 RepID=UPI001C2CB8F3|nr:type II toxin-antitoxin system ParD family antitoxin [Thalassococcus sp. S3]
MAPQDQLGLGDLLAEAAETNAAREFESDTAHLPGTLAEAIAFHTRQIEAHHAAMLACNIEHALIIRREARLLARKLNGGVPGILAHDDAPGYVLARHCAAPEGQVPLWGQEGTFEIDIAGVACRITFNGMFGIGATAMTYLAFDARAVDKAHPFISGTGYRSFLGATVPPQTGLVPDQFASQVIAQYVADDLGGRLVVPACAARKSAPGAGLRARSRRCIRTAFDFGREDVVGLSGITRNGRLMSMVKKSITVTDQQDAFIQAQIASGRYASDSEVIREALREKELRIAELDALRAKLIASEESGISPRTPEEIRAAVRERLTPSS